MNFTEKTMLFLLLFKPKLNFTEKTMLSAFLAFSRIPMVKAEYLKGIVAPTSAKAGKAGKALVFSVKLLIVTYNWRKSIGFLSVFVYHKLKAFGFVDSSFKIAFGSPCVFAGDAQVPVAYY